MSGARRATSGAVWAVTVVICLLALCAVPGCSGCTSKSPEEVRAEMERLKKEKPKEPFEPLRVVTLPNEKFLVENAKSRRSRRAETSLLDSILGIDDEEAKASIGDDELIGRTVKPGHWSGLLVHAKANNFDFSGELSSAANDSQQRPLPLESSLLDVITSRQAALPKAQAKVLETIFFAPPPDAARPRTITWVANKLTKRGGMEFQEQEPLRHMPEYQYHLLVLSRDPNRYRYLKVLDSIRPPVAYVASNAEDMQYYRVLLPRTDQPLALATHPLCWTSLAHVVWDEVRPTALSPEQQQAMLDWLHWGGSLIISGPQTLDLLAGSFLEPYLPATAGESINLDTAALARMSEHWTIPGPDSARPLAQREAWSGVRLIKTDDAEFTSGSGDLIAERRVGRGRIVTTAFRLSEPDLVGWGSFDGFLSGCLLGRPPRRFNAQTNEMDFYPGGGQTKLDRFNPRLVTQLSYFTRDTWDVAGFWERPNKILFDQVKDPNLTALQLQQLRQTGGLPAADEFDTLKTMSGPAGWSDSNLVATSSRSALQSAARISVPNRRFVLWMLSAYLIVLVPVNWLVCRALGRVEWAWIAVPVLAVGWGLAVIRMAQLDIGFARSETEIAILELQSDYPRAHLTRYTALYSSLTTPFTIKLADASAVALPFSAGARQFGGQSRSTVTLNTGEGCQLSSFMVQSNSTGMVHSEQMFDLGGELNYRQVSPTLAVLENNTRLKLSNVALVRRVTSDGEPAQEVAWLGDLKPGAKADVRFVPREESEHDEHRQGALLTSSSVPDGELSLKALVDVAESTNRLNDGDVRLVAWRDDPAGLLGIEVAPSCSQSRRATLVVAHLKFGPKPAPLRDFNKRSQTAYDEP